MKKNNYNLKQLLEETKKREEKMAKDKFKEEQKRIRSKMFMVRG